MRTIGIGFRAAAQQSSLQDALAQVLMATDNQSFDAVVTEAAKARDPIFRTFATEIGVPGLGVTQSDLTRMITPTQSQRIRDRFGTGSLAEAAALAAAGPNAQLVVSRVVSTDGMATAALAEG
ncbi:cobalamin biosynthesis protein [Sulfitobacter aestuariivivens]|uniref:Cobalamin biosynthesis protein n=1 Tax=Sulfitobacter aestuariivivens TaxID=2766981 RepID=A0A927D856_9RHOB|nr:cobalamin biosynthesis protein [Sulfitobacter aestuariivivens]MBD3665549.1 cobalamin biosynthesis protein [Sulfitobacter aestuariivivens]